MFVVEHTNDEYKVTDSRIPRDGIYYAEDMKNIFPRSIRNDMDEVYNDGTIEKLERIFKNNYHYIFINNRGDFTNNWKDPYRHGVLNLK